MAQVQNNRWLKSVSKWKRIIQERSGHDEDGHVLLDIKEIDVVMTRHSMTDDKGNMTDCFAETPAIMAGLKRLHVYAA